MTAPATPLQAAAAWAGRPTRELITELDRQKAARVFEANARAEIEHAQQLAQAAAERAR